MDDRSTGPPSRSDIGDPRFERTAKPDGRLRWLTRLDPAGDATYREAVRPLAGRIERALGAEVFAIRTRPAPGGWRLLSWEPARVAWRRTLRRAIAETTRGTTFAVADIQDCYGSISPETIARLLGPEAAPTVDFLRHVHERGVRGLPIGPDPSAVLANAVLSELDRAIRNTGARHLRWVDDIVLWGSRGEVGSALRVLDVTASRMGLALHPSKTKFLADLREARTVALGERDSSIIAAP